MSCAQHKDVPTEVQTPQGGLCAWCEVLRLRRDLQLATDRANQAELELARSEDMLGKLRGRIERAAGL